MEGGAPRFGIHLRSFLTCRLRARRRTGPVFRQFTLPRICSRGLVRLPDGWHFPLFLPAGPAGPLHGQHRDDLTRFARVALRPNASKCPPPSRPCFLATPRFRATDFISVSAFQTRDIGPNIAQTRTRMPRREPPEPPGSKRPAAADSAKTAGRRARSSGAAPLRSRVACGARVANVLLPSRH